VRIGLATLHKAGEIALFNTAASQILGYSAHEACSVPRDRIFVGLSDQLAGLSGNRSEGTPETQLKTVGRHKDGHEVPLLITPYLAPDNDERSNGQAVILLFQDSRDLGKLEKQLSHLDRLQSLDQFAAGIVHEIRNPLAGISTNAQYILERVKKNCQKLCAKGGPAEQFHEEMVDVLADVHSIESIVNKVLDFAHPGKSKIVEAPVDELVKDVLRYSRMPLRRQNILLSTNFGESTTKVKMDVAQIQQVLLNIIRNACEAMPKGGELRVSTSCLAADKEHVRVEVEDTGGGIAKEHHERIFDPFFSMHREGTGLGLAISRKIVENHGGRIVVKSELGKGTQFAIVLPAVKG
jgi:two-component system sensor histidine kinase AtoS